MGWCLPGNGAAVASKAQAILDWQCIQFNIHELGQSPTITPIKIFIAK